MRRKIVQLAAAYAEREDEDTPPADRLFALCDDGSVWIWVSSYYDGAVRQPDTWDRLADIPQGAGK